MDSIESIEDIVALVLDDFEDWQMYGNVKVVLWQDWLLFSYTTKAQYSEEWNFFERVSRGLIINKINGEIAARPFDKFFNWGEGGRTTAAPLSYVMEKIDGSLGILFRQGNQPRIATRGAFMSKQARWASSYLWANYDLSTLPDEVTLLFEIIKPKNRIVIDYGKRRDLVLLGGRNRFNGRYLAWESVVDLAEEYGFSLPRLYPFDNVEQLIAKTRIMSAREEGYVAVFADGSRFKFKSHEYLRLHKLITSLTFKNVLAAVRENTVDDILAVVPDEFLTQTRQWIKEIHATVQDIENEVHILYERAPRGTRKEFALWVMDEHWEYSKYLFARYDDRDIKSLILQHHDWEQLHETTVPEDDDGA